MLLKHVEITHFRSVRGTCTIAIDPTITVLLGANDHGKSNLLRALDHLNDETVFTEDDLHWDEFQADRSLFPSVIAEFALSAEEANELGRLAAVEGHGAEALDAADKETDEDGDEDGDEEDESEVVEVAYPSGPIRLGREGLPGVIKVNGVELTDWPDDFQKWFETVRPRFELFETFSGAVQDQAEQATLSSQETEFIQGIFFLAGLPEEEWGQLFKQDARTSKRLADASTLLNTNLRGMWGQGANLTFQLQHQGETIQLYVKDPGIHDRYVRLSKRSTGVTHFFRLSMVLEARKRKSQAKAYVFLFDEPGVYLHPVGQRDLLQVLELIGERNQIVLTTHSLFMVSANYPERHRLVMMSEQGTTIDHKPYRASWRRATDALGVRLGSFSLFADTTLLVEGESDPLYLYELVRQLNLLGKTDIDANRLGIVSYSDVPTLKYLIQVLVNEPDPPRVAVLLDGDEQGASTKRQIKDVCRARKVKVVELASGASIEDLCLLRNQFRLAIEDAVVVACESEGKEVPPKLAEKIEGELKGRVTNQQTLGRWFKEFSARLIGEEVSKVGVARRYVERCRDMFLPTTTGELKRGIEAQTLAAAKKVVSAIAAELNLPSRRADEVVLGTDE
jgi:predicted ATP-dependent endonuclease of OLD family